MLTEFKFVQGAVARKDFLPALTHFVIEGGTVRGFNGTIALCAPVPLDLECKPKAEPLVRAIGNCDDTIQLSLTKAGRLSVRSGSFKAFVDCVDGETPHVVPTGERCEVNGAALLAALKAVEPFIGEDASRPWCNGVLLAGPSVYATNNIIAVEYWAGSTLPIVVNLPRMAVRELLRIGTEPVGAQFDETSVTFHYPEGRWLRTQLLPSDWPDLTRVLNVEASPQPFPPGIFPAIAKLKPFADKLRRVYFRDGQACTHEAEGEGASASVEGLAHAGVYNADMLELLDGVAHSVDFSLYPRPCPFQGERLRGVIIGMRA